MLAEQKQKSQWSWASGWQRHSHHLQVGWDTCSQRHPTASSKEHGHPPSWKLIHITEPPHLQCVMKCFSKNKFCDYFLKNPITLHLSFGKTERVNLSNKHIRNSPNQLQLQSLFSHSLSHLNWWDANPSFQLLRPENLEATLIVPFLSHPTFRVSGNPTGFTLSISTVWLLIMLTIVTTVPSHSLSHYNSLLAARPASTIAPVPHHQSIFNMAASVNPLKYNRSIHLSAQKPQLPIMVE